MEAPEQVQDRDCDESRAGLNRRLEACAPALP